MNTTTADTKLQPRQYQGVAPRYDAGDVRLIENRYFARVEYAPGHTIGGTDKTARDAYRRACRAARCVTYYKYTDRVGLIVENARRQATRAQA